MTPDGSIEQDEEQHVPGAPPWSQASGPSTTPLPQTQTTVPETQVRDGDPAQVSPVVQIEPSSHGAPAALATSAGQTADVPVQVSGKSQSEAAGRQTAEAGRKLQVTGSQHDQSPSTGSHASPHSTTPLPQVAAEPGLATAE